MQPDLNLLHLFRAVAESRNFRAAADRLGVTRSAVSQGVRRLEDALGVALVQRSTRSVRLTEAGERLHAQVAGALSTLATALEEAGGDASPRGVLRVAVASIAEPFLNGPLVASFVQAYPHITLDVTVTDQEFDIVAAGFDAGVRLGEVIEQDMVAVPLGGPQRELAVAAPSYLAAHGVPVHPRELVRHRCIGWRARPELAPYRWEFVEDGRPFDVQVEPQLTTNDLSLMIRAALAGAGITFAPEACFRPWLERGELVPLLRDYLPPFPGFYLYFPARRHTPPRLRALVDHVKAAATRRDPT
ncbi:LysR family transcriptional regulator [Pseudoxanthomonas sp. SGNA-20]|uniref:LysR family transcriptional regulator n=1 Tax=Pseudoxanthomonas sp. SGNA-20 TaxID=2493088 RepID=UPI000F63C3E7|nr:LysR family transcriptional regulator [Pseudoxanthomonas sp. SGNA-20]RRN59416.1 LysR family transcriptional regulator [Pseudoxanthomonas sp. SGNA-20]